MKPEVVTTNDLSQIALPFGPYDDTCFSSFVGESNAKTAQILEEHIRSEEEAFVYLAGPEGSGKTHLAISVLKVYEELDMTSAYLSLPSLVQAAGADLAGAYEAFKGYDALVIEDLQKVLPNPRLESFLFNLFNELKVSMRHMLVTANCSVSQLNLTLPDLVSRYNSGLSLRLNSMSDNEKQEIFRQVARVRGLEVSADVSAYIIRRSGRHLGALLDLLNALDKASWVEKQKLSIPFVKKTLGW
jgi:DnaA-homolog protein